MPRVTPLISDSASKFRRSSSHCLVLASFASAKEQTLKRLIQRFWHGQSTSWFSEQEQVQAKFHFWNRMSTANFTSLPQKFLRQGCIRQNASNFLHDAPVRSFHYIILRRWVWRSHDHLNSIISHVTLHRCVFNSSITVKSFDFAIKIAFKRWV